MDLKIKDVADLLNVSETTIRRWLTDGKIPAYKINHQYRFNRLEIENWVMGQRINQSSASDAQAEKKINSDESLAKGGRKQFSLYRAVHQGDILVDIPGKTKKEIIRNTMERVAKSLDLDPEVASELLLQREKLQSTALNHGIALPHARESIIRSGKDAVFVVFPPEPLDYDSLDGEPVHTLFFLFASEDKNHLHLLAKIAHLSSQEGTLEFLRSRPSKEKLMAFIREWEGSIQKVLSH